jgi:hypothetical protein
MAGRLTLKKVNAAIKDTTTYVGANVQFIAGD